MTGLDSGAMVSVAVLAGGGPAEGLVEALGSARAGRVRELLVSRALAWACDAFGATAVRMLDRDPRDGGWAAGLADPRAGGDPGWDAADDPAVPSAHAPVATAAGVTIALAPELAVWAPELAAELVDDLRAGCALSLGPVYDGGAYLVAVGDAAAGARELVTAVDPGSRAAMTGAITAAGERGWDVGLLRSERALRRPADVAALLADPLCDAELRGLLG